MNRNETIKLLAVLNAAYPSFFRGMSKTEKQAQIELYESRFKDFSAKIVAAALERYIDTNTYPPTIAGIKTIINAYQGGSKIDELWEEAWKAICGRRKFADLSAANQKYFGNQSAIDELGLSGDTVMSVVKGQYLKRISEILEVKEAQTQAVKALGKEQFDHILLDGTRGSLE